MFWYGILDTVTLSDEIALLRTENAALTVQIAVLEQQFAAAPERIAELEQQRPCPPPIVKSNKSKPDDLKHPRRKRSAQHHRECRCDVPTRIALHTLDHCPDFHFPLRGSSTDYHRQVVELPSPQPVVVNEHRVIKHWYPSCQCWHSPKLDLTGQVFRQGRIGVRIASLMDFLELVLRVPGQWIQADLCMLHPLRISTVEIVALLHQVRRMLQSKVDALKQQARASLTCAATKPGDERTSRTSPAGIQHPRRRRAVSSTNMMPARRPAHSEWAVHGPSGQRLLLRLQWLCQQALVLLDAFAARSAQAEGDPCQRCRDVGVGSGRAGAGRRRPALAERAPVASP